MLDPITTSRLGVIRQQEILEAAACDRQSPVLQPVLCWVGQKLIAAGERLTSAARPAFAEPVQADDSLCEPEPC